MIPRVPEPELMDDQTQALAYAEADFSEPNTLFLDLYRQLHPQPPHGARVLDLGCGPADISLRFALAYPEVQVLALDGSASMLAHARAALEKEPGLAARVELLCETLPCEKLEAGRYDVLLSNSLLHHLHRPGVLWETLRHAARPGAAVLVMDLFRPQSATAARAIVETYATDAPEILRRDFHNSLLAAFTPEEVETQLEAAGLARLQVAPVSDRHLAVSGRL